MPITVHTHLDQLPPTARGHVIAIGNFDGVHLGHQVVITAAAQEAIRLKTELGVLCFAPNPRQFFQPDAPPNELMPMTVRAKYLEQHGVRQLYVQTFDAAFSRLTPDEFLSNILKQHLGVKHIVVGQNFHFGHQRKGNMDYLLDRAGHHGFGVTVAPTLTSSDGLIYSSTNVREMLTAGDVRGAAKILGRPHEIEGEVIHGDARARGLGFPTANILLGMYHRPRYGVYVVKAKVGDTWYGGVANVGIRPTVGGDKELFEVHLFDFAGDLYGKTLRVQLLDFLRAEQKFASFDALTAQIAADAEAAQKMLLAA